MAVDVAGDEGDESGRPGRRRELDASPCLGVLVGIGVQDVEVGLQLVLLAHLRIAVVIGLVDHHFIVVRQGGGAGRSDGVGQRPAAHRDATLRE